LYGRFLAIFVCIAIVCSGCGGSKSTSGIESILDAEEPEPSGAKQTLPESYGPFDRDDRTVRHVQAVISRIVPRGRSTDQYNVSALQARAKRFEFSPVVVGKADLEVLKAFVASDLAPVVITRSPVGPKHIRAMVGYRDSVERLVLIDPVNYAEARFSYSDFSKQWDDPQDGCLLIFPQRTILKEKIESILTRYLPEEKVKSLLIRIPKRR
jgi:hypothetical protein